MNGGAQLGQADLVQPLEAAESLLLACRAVAARHPEGQGADAHGYDMLTIQLALQAIVGSSMAAEMPGGPTVGGKASVTHERFQALWLGVGSGLGHALSNCGSISVMESASESLLLGMGQAILGRDLAGTGPKG